MGPASLAGDLKNNIFFFFLFFNIHHPPFTPPFLLKHPPPLPIVLVTSTPTPHVLYSNNCLKQAFKPYWKIRNPVSK